MSAYPMSADPAERARFRRGFGVNDTDARGRKVCAEAGHLVCTGDYCGGACACTNDDTGDFSIRVSTDKDGDTLCKECRYEMKAAGWNR